MNVGIKTEMRWILTLMGRYIIDTIWFSAHYHLEFFEIKTIDAHFCVTFA